ncbi:hypothetical protein LZ30DRAFT_386208 [Colletotrichum cereale]|nr:hypothetical protein LZ30DRAFT_386208 [Colletotrichum cereale]
MSWWCLGFQVDWAWVWPSFALSLSLWPDPSPPSFPTALSKVTLTGSRSQTVWPVMVVGGLEILAHPRPDVAKDPGRPRPLSGAGQAMTVSSL